MYYGAIYEYKNKYKLKFSDKISACYSTFLSKIQFEGEFKKYLHIYFNPYPEFTFKEVEFLLKSLRKDFKFTLRKFKPDEIKTYEYSIHHSFYGKSTFKKGKIYPVVSIRISDMSLGKIKFLYHFIRIFHETKNHTEITRKVINAKKLLPKELIINLLIFFTLTTNGGSGGHTLFIRNHYRESYSFKKFKSLQQFVDKYISEDKFENIYLNTLGVGDSFEELIEIYKNI